MRRLLISTLLLLAVAPAQSAQAQLVGEFDAAIRNVQPWGAYTVVASARVYDTTGAPAPRLASATVHFPRGASLRSAFLSRRYWCDGSKLLTDPDPALCRNAQFASGSLLLDARPAIEDPVPASIWLFLDRGGAHGSQAGIVILVRANERSPAWNFDVLHGYLIREPASASRFGYRLELPTTLQPLLPQVTLSLIEMKLRIPGTAAQAACERLPAPCRGPLRRARKADEAHVLAQGAPLPAGPQGRVRGRLCIPRREPDLEAAKREVLPLRRVTRPGQGRDPRIAGGGGASAGGPTRSRRAIPGPHRWPAPAP